MGDLLQKIFSQIINKEGGAECGLFVLGLHTTFGADAFENIIDALQLETVGEFYYRHMNLRKTESAVTDSAVEMRVLVLYNLFTFAIDRTNIILYRAASIVNGMYESMCKKEIESTRDSAFVNSWQQPL